MIESRNGHDPPEGTPLGPRLQGDNPGPRLRGDNREDPSTMAKPKKMAKDVRGQASELASKIGPRVEQAREMAGPLLVEAREKAGPALSDARDKLGDRLTNDVLPALSAAVAAADHATEDVREEARRRGLAAAAALRGEVEPPKKHHRIRTLLIMLGLGGVAAAVAKMLSDRQASTAWQSSYTPPPAPASGPLGSGNDEAGATPDVAAADKQTEPHDVTTPENPAVEEDLSGKKTE